MRSLTQHLSPAVAVVQERKIWAPSTLPSLGLVGCLKVFLFNIYWFVGCFVVVNLCVVKWILTLGTSDLAYDSHAIAERFVALSTIRMFIGDVEVTGMENLPDPKSVPAPVYIANHASQVDVGVVYSIYRRFKWIAKESVLFL